MSGNMGCMARDVSDDNPLTPEEALDSDEVRNDDGDEVVDPPERVDRCPRGRVPRRAPRG